MTKQEAIFIRTDKETRALLKAQAKKENLPMTIYLRLLVKAASAK